MRYFTIRFLLITLCAFMMASSATAATHWATIEQLESQGKFADIPTALEKVIRHAKQKQNHKDWRDALLLSSSFRFSTHPEDALNYLTQQSWPNDPDSQLLINLHLGHYLHRYMSQYSWEIQKREKIETDKPLSISQKTFEQLQKDAHHAFHQAYRLSLTRHEPISSINTLPIKRFKQYINEGDYPKTVRGSIRDTVTYLWIQALQNTSLWSNEHTHQSHYLPLKKLLTTPYPEAIDVSQSTTHPLHIIVKLSQELAQFHQSQQRPEASLEAFRVKLSALSEVKNTAHDTQQIIQLLRLNIKQAPASLPWVNQLRLELSRYLAKLDTPTSYIQRLALMKHCINADNNLERLRQRCQSEVEQITQPTFSLSTMQTDGLHKRSLQVRYKNLEQLYFRAWRLTPEQAIQTQQKQQRQKALTQLLNTPNSSAYQWQSKLAKTTDYRHHNHYVTAPIKQKGYWLIAASTAKDFKKPAQTLWTEMSLSNLVADIRPHDKTLQVTTYLGESGQIAANVEVALWKTQHNTNNGDQKISVVRSAKDGQATLALPDSHRYKVTLQYNDDFTLLDPVYSGYRSNANTRSQKAALIFTDRAIYRPAQRIQWKVVAYQGNGQTGRYQVLPNQSGWVKLLDANGKLVKKVAVTSNRFGSASGEFVAASGRLLGNWSIQSSWGGHQSLKVEEYKRPTFKATLDDPKQALRFNQPTKLSGSARYYFGDALTSGQVNWQVKRLASYYHSGYQRAQIIASGSSELNDKGLFFIPLHPKAPAQANSQSDTPLVYRYAVSADITDSGGETRSVSRTFSVASLNIRAHIKSPLNFAHAGKAFELQITRQDLEGIGRAGSGFWTLHRLQQPGTPQMPAERPVTDIKKAALPYATSGDLQHPRWADAPSFEALTKHWKNAAQISQGSLRHNAQGEAQLQITAPTAGLYRLSYTTKDQWGQVFQTNKVLMISTAQALPAKLPALLQVQKRSVEVGQAVQLLAGSAYTQTPTLLEVFHGNTLLRRSLLRGGIKAQQFAVTPEHRGGLNFVLTMVKDYQLIRRQQRVEVPWTDRQLNVSFSSFRDQLRLGQKETWRITVKDDKDKPLESGAVEVLASMYDRSLDLLQKHTPITTKHLYHTQYFSTRWQNNLGQAHSYQLYAAPRIQPLHNLFYQSGKLTLIESSHQYELASPMPRAMAARPMMKAAAAPVTETSARADTNQTPKETPPSTSEEIATGAIRSNFNETAFFKPHLILEKNGSVSFEFEVPESLTQWKVWVSAISRDLKGGTASALTRTSKALMVRPYLPRFLRVGDQANIEVLVNNSSDQAFSGELNFEVLDPATGDSLSVPFKLNTQARRFSVPALQSTRQRYTLTVPKQLGMVTIRAKASATNGQQHYADGEQRPLPILPSRIHLSQSRFAALKGNSTRQLRFDQLAQNHDQSRINDKLVITVDGQLLLSTLKALPYLANYPYECTEQTLNRFLSTSIINQSFAQSPSLKAMAAAFSARKTPLENWSSIENDPNSHMLLEETPWLAQANGKDQTSAALLNILDPKIALQQQQRSLNKLLKAQTHSGGFPWWEGGHASAYMTTYLLQGFAKALEFKINIPKAPVQRAWQYLHQHYLDTLANSQGKPLSQHQLIALNYTLSAFPDSSWYNTLFSPAERQTMLKQSLQNWQTLSPLLKAQLALTVHRIGNHQQAQGIFESVMNSAKSNPDTGVYWPTQARAWLWYNDTIDSHAFMLRAMMEISPQDPRRHGLVQWLMMNKKLNHWKSTRATAESIYSLVHYMKREKQLDVDERMLINIGQQPAQEMVFKANTYQGGKQQIVIEGENITPDMADIKLSNLSQPLMFASANWHFSTESLPQSAQGDFFKVTRRLFKRVKQGNQWVLQPLAEGARISLGDQLEVQLRLHSKHNAEFVQLRAPRGAGFEPMQAKSAYRWQQGVGFYQEVKDSGSNYFFDYLPQGEYSFKYRLRATTSGTFRIAPAMVQSVYAPEFNAYSRGTRLSIQ